MHTSNLLEEAHFEYFKMRCYSFQKSNLLQHYKKMCKRHQILGGVDDPSMKHAFITSFLKAFSDETFHLMKVKNKYVFTTSLGEIFKHVIEAV